MLGLASQGPSVVGPTVVAAWDAFLDLVDDVDLSRPSRLPGWSNRDTCVHLGTWDDHRVLDRIVEAARTDGGRTPRSVDDDNARLVAAHAGASDEEVRAALRLSRDLVAAWLLGPEAEELGLRLVRSSVGELPLLSLVHAGCYELAVHGLDLEAKVPDALLQQGLAALMDVTGSLASKAAIGITVTAQTPQGGWSFTGDAQGWTVDRVPPGRFEGVGATGTAVDLLEASAGRAHVPVLLAQRRLRVQDLPGFMRLAPVLDQAPNLPGGAVLKTGVKAVSGLTSGVGKLLGRFR